MAVEQLDLSKEKLIARYVEPYLMEQEPITIEHNSINNATMAIIDKLNIEE